LRVDPDDEMVATVELDEERLSVLMKISVSSGPPIAASGTSFGFSEFHVEISNQERTRVKRIDDGI
jgi:hypothetical protein